MIMIFLNVIEEHEQSEAFGGLYLSIDQTIWNQTASSCRRLVRVPYVNALYSRV